MKEGTMDETSASIVNFSPNLRDPFRISAFTS